VHGVRKRSETKACLCVQIYRTMTRMPNSSMDVVWARIGRGTVETTMRGRVCYNLKRSFRLLNPIKLSMTDQPAVRMKQQLAYNPWKYPQ
jgi:hypothetical protein